MKRVGIYSGSFNPIHIGHLALANYLCEYEQFDEIWFVVSPVNPWKEGETLLPYSLRLKLVEMSIGDYPHFKASDFEAHLPQPSYTYHTMEVLRHTYPGICFSLIVGADNWTKFENWKNWQEIVAHHDLYVYPRKGYSIDMDKPLPDYLHIVHSPILEISSTFVRQAIQEGRDIRFFVHPAVWRCLCDHQIKNNFITN